MHREALPVDLVVSAEKIDRCVLRLHCMLQKLGRHDVSNA